MKISDIRQLLDAELICGEEYLDRDVYSACGSDMMSDVLAYVNQDRRDDGHDLHRLRPLEKADGGHDRARKGERRRADEFKKENVRSVRTPLYGRSPGKRRAA